MMKLTANHSTYELLFDAVDVPHLPAVLAVTFEKDTKEREARLETENITLRVERNAAMERVEQLEADAIKAVRRGKARRR